MKNVCPRCRSQELEENPIALTAKCLLCGWQGPSADCLAVTRDGMIIEKVMERMVHRLSSYVGRGVAKGILEFAQEYSIRVRKEDLQRITVKIVTLVLKTLHEELLALAPKNLKDKVEATNILLADPPAPVELPMLMKEIHDGVIEPEGG